MADVLGTQDALAEETSFAFLGQWQRLVSSTNWEKGRIIHEWREALIAAQADPTQFSDEAWSRRVRSVSGQHVGRLRRVFERFGSVCATYPGLYWSHFQAALDWNDAEMWLEGAVQNGWSISQMRAKRWEACGSPGESQPNDAEVVEAELDEDFADHERAEAEIRDPASPRAPGAVEGGPDYSQGPDFGDEPAAAAAGVAFDADAADYPGLANQSPVRPFEHLSALPADLAEAFESYKLAILRHKIAGWLEVSRDDVVASLRALEELALATA